jgi:hypothetical protein
MYELPGTTPGTFPIRGATPICCVWHFLSIVPTEW